MNATPELGWLLMALLGAFGLVQILRALAIRVRNEVAMHDLKVSVSEIQAQNYRATMLRHGVTPGGGDEAEEIIEVGSTLSEAKAVSPAGPAAETEPRRDAA